MAATRIRQRIDAPRERVYGALVDREAVARWKVPAGMTCEVHEFDAREGGAVRVSLTYDAPDRAGKTRERTDTYRGRFVRLVPNELVVEVDEFETDDAELTGEMTTTITLADADGGTDLAATHEGLPEGLSLADNHAGWQQALTRLKALVESSPAEPERAALSPMRVSRMELQGYTDDDYWLTKALETDPEVMRELGGPIEQDKLLEIHRRRLADPWWFKIVAEPGGPAVGTIGVWATRHGNQDLHETGWMVRPAHQGRGIASGALRLLIERVNAERRFASIHAFPPVNNAPSNALCRKFGFVLLGQADFVYAGRTLHCNHWSLDSAH